ncbi:MAG: hypothetical protein RMJ35_13970, partial [Phycisphaerales bacterium]|nr:hypothetical protein [Phycisphaerales bacterium]
MKLNRWILAAAWLLGWCARPAPAAPDASEGWSAAVESFLSSLVTGVAPEEITLTLQPRHVVRTTEGGEAALAEL